MITIVDVDALLGLANPKDIHHDNSKLLFNKLADFGVDTILLPTVLGEFALLASSRIGMVQTKKAISGFLATSYGINSLDENLTREAVQLYHAQTSKEESLFDCFVMVSAKKLNADCIFSFDRGYTKNGFVLAGDFVQKINKAN